MTTEIYAVVDALNNPLRCTLTAGQISDINQASELIDGLTPDMVIGDKGYDADKFVAQIQSIGTKAVIPPKRNRLQQH